MPNDVHSPFHFDTVEVCLEECPARSPIAGSEQLNRQRSPLNPLTDTLHNQRPINFHLTYRSHTSHQHHGCTPSQVPPPRIRKRATRRPSFEMGGQIVGSHHVVLHFLQSQGRRPGDVWPEITIRAPLNGCAASAVYVAGYRIRIH